MNAFLPAFGNKPTHIIGRAGVRAEFIEGLTQPVGHRSRTTLLIGQRGTGKTTLLLDFAEVAANEGYVCARVAANNEMLDEIIQGIQIEGLKHVSKSRTKVTGVSVGVMGFSFGLSFNEAAEKQLGFRMKLSLLCDELAKHGKSILILVDEVNSNTSEMRTLATTYQHLIGEQKNIAIVMAGLPASMSAVLNDDILTFLNRAHKVHLEPLPTGEMSIAYKAEFERCGKSITQSVLKEAVSATRGYPYLFQLIGYYILTFAQNQSDITSEIVRMAISTSKDEMVDGIFGATLKPLSRRDKDFIAAMSVDEGISRVSDVQRRMQVSKSYVQTYRTRLIEFGIIASMGRGELVFQIPYLGEYLRGEL